MPATWRSLGASQREWKASGQLIDQFATLNKVHAQYGYWVHAQGFITQRVQLIGGINRTDLNVVPPDLVSIPTNWRVGTSLA